jgi:isoleucyl-tRNA synthetase
MFQPVSSKPNFVAQEHAVLDLWTKTDAFRTLWAMNKGNKRWSFVDGPITANNPWAYTTPGAAPTKTSTSVTTPCRAKTSAGKTASTARACGSRSRWKRSSASKPSATSSVWPGRTSSTCARQRVLNYAAVQTEQSIRLGYWMDWNDPGELRRLSDMLKEDPQPASHRGGPTWPNHRHRGAGRRHVGHAPVGGSYFTFSDENNYQIWALPQDVPRQRLALQRARRHALVRPLRHRHQPARNRHRWLL